MKKISKKILYLAIITLFFSMFISFSNPTPSYAASFEGRLKCPSFLGLISWDCGVGKINNQNALETGALQIASNIATDISVIAAYLIIAYVMYGGYLYIFSGGDPNKTANGKKTIARAFIGLAITMSSYTIMSTIRFVLIGQSNSLGDCLDSGGCVSPGVLVTNTIHWVASVAGIVSAIFIVFGGISYITSSGDPSKLKKAKDIILYALIGLVIVALTEIITAFVSSAIRDANENAFINQTIISKEAHEIKIN